MESSINSIHPVGNLGNIINQKSLKWIFVGGKGGVGKTTVSSTLSIELAKTREKVLIISTDPAHNLSDAFTQKLGGTATPIKGFSNLFGLEIDPKEATEDDANFGDVLGMELDNDTKDIFEQLKNTIPGIDEALCIGLLLQTVDKMEFETVVFDTAPTGHTLRMLSFPALLEQGLEKLNGMQNGMGGMITGMLSQTMGDGMKNLKEMMELFKTSITKIHQEFMKKEHTTFVAVCIPEFLSLYETERLIQELEKEQIDCHNIVINQVLFPEEGCNCDMCNSRFNMQKKYINQIKELYEDEDVNDTKMTGESGFKISILPFQENEIRGHDDLLSFTKFIVAI